MEDYLGGSGRPRTPEQYHDRCWCSAVCPRANTRLFTTIAFGSCNGARCADYSSSSTGPTCSSPTTTANLIDPLASAVFKAPSSPMVATISQSSASTDAVNMTQAAASTQATSTAAAKTIVARGKVVTRTFRHHSCLLLWYRRLWYPRQKKQLSRLLQKALEILLRYGLLLKDLD